MNPTNKSSIRQVLKIALLLMVVILLVTGVRWATYARPPLQESIDALENDDFVEVFENPWLTFMPITDTPDIGFIFYPGGRIQPSGYSSIMHSISSEGYLVVVPEMPINMAVFNPNIADKIIAQYPEVSRWVIAGHSIGGTMAAQYAIKHEDKIDGLMIWASYPAENADLTNATFPVVTIYGSEDPRVNDISIGERSHLYPQDAEFVRIEGGDHHQFGAYVIKPEEDHAEISRTSQHDQIIQATLRFLETISQSE